MDAGRVDGIGRKTNEEIVLRQMAIVKGKPNAGQGGKIGHSNQDHWLYTEEIKEAARKWRRLHAKSEVAAGLKEIDDDKGNREQEIDDGLSR